MGTLITLNPIVRIARVPLHPRERFRVQTAAAGAGRRRSVRGRRGNRVRGRNETRVRSFHDALQWRMCNGVHRGFLFCRAGIHLNSTPRDVGCGNVFPVTSPNSVCRLSSVALANVLATSQCSIVRFPLIPAMLNCTPLTVLRVVSFAVLKGEHNGVSKR